MHNAPKPAGGQPANLPAEISAKRTKPLTLGMSIEIPDDWNPHKALIEIADYAAMLCQRGEKIAEKAREIEERAERLPDSAEDKIADLLAEAADIRGRSRIDISSVRDINHRVCILAMRLSACRITIPREDSPAEMIAEIAAYTGPHYGRMSEAYAARQALPDHPAEAEESLRATIAAVRAEAKAEAANAAAKAAAATLESARSAASK